MDSVLIVTNVLDGRRYRLVIKGNLRRITGAKVKKYMVAHVGSAAHNMLLRFNGRDMQDTVTAGDLGIQSGDTIMLEPLGVSPRSGIGGGTSVASSLQQAQLVEADSLDDQRGLFEMETDKRQQQYTRTINEIAAEMSERERQAQMLEEDLKERQLQVQRLEAERAAAHAEKKRLEEMREAEQRKQQERETELQRRQEQLMLERERQRELELKKMEIEKKHKLIEQQRQEAALEKERVERDRREYEERMLRQQEELREREAQLERDRLEQERRSRELLRDKAHLDSQRAFESQTFGKERELDEMRLHEIQHGGRKQMEIPVATLHANHNHANHASDPGRHDSWSGNSLQHPQPSGSSLPVVGQQQVSPAMVNLGKVSVAASSPALGPHGDIDCDSLAQANLEDLAMHLGHPLSFDQSQTCVVDVDDKHTIMISYDRETEGLYVYSSLLCNLPRDPSLKLKLYELLMEGALLGRDMAGGGVGLSLKDDFILMCTSIPLHSCHTHALRLAVPQFSEALRKWRRRIKDLLTEPGAAGLPESPPPQHHPSLAQPPQQPPAMHPPAQIAAPLPAEHVPGVMLPNAMHDVPDTEPQYDWAPANPPSSSPLAPPSAPGDGEAYAVIGVELTDGVTIDGVHTQYSSGVIVVRVKGPAAAAGMQESDIIKFVNGRRVTNLTTFQEITAQLIPEQACQFVLERAGQEMTIDVRPTKGYKRPGEQKRYRAPADTLLRSGRT